MAKQKRSEIETLRQEVARLQSVNDHLDTEISHLDALLREVGFSEGLVSVRAAARELLDEDLA